MRRTVVFKSLTHKFDFVNSGGRKMNLSIESYSLREKVGDKKGIEIPCADEEEQKD